MTTKQAIGIERPTILIMLLERDALLIYACPVKIVNKIR